MVSTNKKIKFKAVFIGKSDNTFINNVIYNLSIPESGSFKITDNDSGKVVVYESLSAFLRNWSHIVHEKMI